MNISNISVFPLDIQLLILEYYNETKEYFIKSVKPLILYKNRINSVYNKNEFVYMTNMKHHYLINVSKIVNMINNDDAYLIENELEYNVENQQLKNIWLRLHITSINNYFGGANNYVIEVLYINKYNYNLFAIKRKCNNENSVIEILEPIKKIHLSNYCNYYSCAHFMHLPENAIKQLH